jgi:ribosomal protein S12 methylthiotransferase
MAKVHIVSLGCPKNLVDSEDLLRKLRESGIHYTSRADDSDIVMVNTCGFIEEASRESVEEILRVAALKEKGLKKLVVFGCLAKRFGSELSKEIPEIDALWGVGDEDRIVEYCRSAISSWAADVARADVPETEHMDNLRRLSDTTYVYVKIAEGCDRKCSYCVIPAIRGPFRSRSPEAIIKEAEHNIKMGMKELILVAQDINSYGKDIGGYDLGRIIREIASIDGNFRVRLLYLYPSALSDDLLETIGSGDKVCKYIDMPLQHSDERILKMMGRGGGRQSFERLIKKIRTLVPGVTLRTTLITGFPGETEEIFEGVVDFVREMRFERLGVFKYSREAGTPASKLKGHVPKRIKEKRHNIIMKEQSAISLEKNKSLVGGTYSALVDESSDGVAIGRLESQAPEIDGVVIIEERNVPKGEFVRVKITEAYDYDLKGVVER